jgi:hypothetical protein
LGRSDTGKSVACWAAFCAAGPGRAVICALPGVWYVVKPPVSAVVPAKDRYCGWVACCAASPIWAVICALPGVWYVVEPPVSVVLGFRGGHADGDGVGHRGS